MTTIDGVKVKHGDTVYCKASCDPWVVNRGYWLNDTFYSTRRAAVDARILRFNELLKEVTAEVLVKLEERNNIESRLVSLVRERRAEFPGT